MCCRLIECDRISIYTLEKWTFYHFIWFVSYQRFLSGKASKGHRWLINLVLSSTVDVACEGYIWLAMFCRIIALSNFELCSFCVFGWSYSCVYDVRMFVCMPWWCNFILILDAKDVLIECFNIKDLIDL